MSQWQAYLWPLLIGTSPERQLARIALANLSTMFSVDLGQILAGSFVLSTIPMILLLFFQKQYAQSLSTTGAQVTGRVRAVGSVNADQTLRVARLPSGETIRATGLSVAPGGRVRTRRSRRPGSAPAPPS